MTIQTMVLLVTATACLGLGVFAILAIASVNQALSGLLTPKRFTVGDYGRTLEPPAVRRAFNAQSKH